MDKNVANLYKLSESVFAVIGGDGATNFGIVRGEDGSALLIDADIRRMDEIESYMKSGPYASLGKTWMVKRNIENFLKEGH